MLRTRHPISPPLLLALLLALLAAPGVAEAQTCVDLIGGPHPNGCSLMAPLFVQNGLDLIFLGACDGHDLCWAQCNGPNPPYLGLSHKAQCDLILATQMEAACLFWAPLISYPSSGWDDIDEFLDDCNEAALIFLGAVNTPMGFNFFWRSQCCRGCNPTGCSNHQPAPLQLPPLCGLGQCYGSFPTPPPGPIPPPFPCPAFEDTRTWVIDGRGEATVAALQLDFDLGRSEPRPESTVYLEEWAVVTPTGEGAFVGQGSSGAFRDRLADSGTAFPPASGEAETVLVVEAPIHPHNRRHAPTPSLDPFAASLTGPGAAEAVELGSFWFRAEVSETGQVDRVALLDAPQPLLSGAVQGAIRGNLRLRYVDDRRHRSVVFARGRIASNGLLEVDNGLVVTSTCCGECCWFPEFNDWVCPCPF